MSALREYTESAARARVVAAALGLGRSINLWSLTLLSLAIAVLLLTSLPLLSIACLLLSILAGALQKFYALRVAFDEPLFRHWAETWQNAANQGLVATTLETDLITLDQAFAACGLSKSTGNLTRDLNSRIRGATNLLKYQLLALSLQFLALISTILPAYF
jgi:hypothetical protein